MLSLFAVVSALLFLNILSVKAQYVPGDGIPQVPNSPWKSAGYVTTVDISSVSLPQLNGKVGYAPLIQSPAVRAATPQTFRILLPNSQDGNLGCSPLRFNYSDDGTPLAGAAVILRRGACTFTVKQQIIKAVNPALFILADSQPHPKMANVPIAYNGDSGLVMNFPSICISVNDANKLISNLAFNLTGNNQVPTISMTIQPSGTVSPAIKTALIDFLSSPVFSAWNPTWVAARAWADVANPALDPCYDRIYGLWCENGKLVRIDMGIGIFNWAGPVRNSIGLLTDLKAIDFSTNSLTSIPNAICSLSNLEYIGVNSNPGLTSFPDCYNQLPLILMWADSCAIQSTISTLGNSPNLVMASFRSSPLSGQIPSTWNTPNLELLDLLNTRSATTGLSGQLPSFAGFQYLRYLDLSNNKLSPPNLADPSTAFNNLPVLQILQISSNPGLTMPLPVFVGTRRLQTLDFSNNNFTGVACPSSWPSNLIEVRTINLRGNQLVSPFNLFGTLNTLTSLDLSSNQLSIIGTVNFANNPMSVLAAAAGTSLNTIDLSNNLLAGDSSATYINTRPALQKINLARNQITSLPTDLFSATGLVSFDISYNRLTGSIPAGTPLTSTVLLDFSNNPQLASSSGNLPSWVSQNLNAFVRSGSSLYFCPTTTPVSPANPALYIGLDPIYYRYKNCACLSGYFGDAPACRQIPSSTSSTNPIINPLKPILQNQTQIPIASIDPLTFSDTWYGSQRSLEGLDSVWNIDFSQVSVSVFNNTAMYSISGSQPNAKSPVVLYLDFFFDLSYFASSTEQVIVTKGGLNGEVAALYRGDESSRLMLLTAVDSKVTSLPSQTRAFVLSFSSIGYARAIVLDVKATVNYKSRDPAGRHFIAMASADSTCPTGFTLRAGSPFCAKDLVEYKVSRVLLAILIALSAFVCLLILITGAYMFAHRESALVRAASRPFTAFMVLCLFFMCGSSILYAVVPSYDGANMLCKARLWCSSFSLTGVLGVLVAKSFRVSVIFGSKVLLQIKNVTDTYVASIVGLLLAVQVVMLIVFDAMDMSWAAQIERGTDQFVWGCKTGNGFDPWMGVQIGLFASVMVAGAVVAFKTRSVPSAFNESQHILFTLQILLFFLIMIVPLDWALVNDAPEASVVFQAGGSLVLSFFILVANFVPKMFLLYQGRGNDKSLVFNTQGRTVSSNASEAGSKSHSSVSQSEMSATATSHSSI